MSFVCDDTQLELVFRVSITSSKHEEELGEFETVMQTRDAVEGFHNCLDEAVETRKKSLPFLL